MSLPHHLAPILLTIFIPLTAYAQTQPTSKPKLPFAISPETTAITAPLTPEGFPDYIAALNQKFSKDVTPENNAFAALLQVCDTKAVISSVPANNEKFLKMLGIPPIPTNTEAFQSFDEFLSFLDADQRTAYIDNFNNLRKRPWKAADAKDTKLAADYLNRESKLLDAIVAASQKPRWWIPMVATNNHLFEALLPSLARIRAMAYALAARAILRADTGDFDGFLTDTIAIKRIALLEFHGGPTLIEQLVAIAIDVIADQTAATVLADGRLTAPQCVRLRNALAQIQPLPPFWLEVERWCQLENAQGIATGTLDLRLHGDQFNIDKDKPDPFALIDRDQVDWNIVLKQINGEFDAIAANHAKIQSVREYVATDTALEQKLQTERKELPGLYEALQKSPDESRDAYSQRIARAVTVVLIPSLGRPEVLRRRALMFDDMLQVLLAAAEIKASTGQWPKDAATITAKSPLKTLPLDIQANPPAPVRYHLLPNGPQVYSVGENNIDDNGLRATNTKDDLAIGADPTANKSP